MKKILCIFLAFGLVFSFCGCNTDKKSEKKIEGTDITQYAKLGQIPECKYTLGQNVSEMIKELKATASNSEEDFYDVFSNSTYGTITTNGADYIYLQKANPKVLTWVISYQTAYGFAIGTSPKDIKNSVEQYCEPAEERSLTKTELKVFSGNDDCTCLEYKIEDKKVVFAFQENGLFATAIIKE